MKVAEPFVTVPCATCGEDFPLSARKVREHRRSGAPHVCRDCRFPAKPIDARRQEALRQWWLDRFTMEELRSWPPLR
jgi:predicted RNA-binding Zn-ribbon protein involved in translation (DUF1610 family)